MGRDREQEVIVASEPTPGDQGGLGEARAARSTKSMSVRMVAEGEKGKPE